MSVRTQERSAKLKCWFWGIYTNSKWQRDITKVKSENQFTSSLISVGCGTQLHSLLKLKSEQYSDTSASKLADFDVDTLTGNFRYLSGFFVFFNFRNPIDIEN